MPLGDVIKQVRNVAATFARPPGLGAPSDPLTRREREVATLVVRGYTNRQIAESLVITERTVDGHVANILSKLELKTRAQVAVWSVEHQLAPLSVEPPKIESRASVRAPAARPTSLP
jgi:DNA-binding NarL/FixJ family response regulator